jgi:8-hydroxy-5-deazaflavin:NADPH oxidoreductase
MREAILSLGGWRIEMGNRGTADLVRRQLLKTSAAVVALGSLGLTHRALAADPHTKETIGVIGSGHVGSALGTVWARAGHPVMFASRDLSRDQKLASEVGSPARAGSPAQAAAFGEVLLFAVPYGALPELGKELAGSIRHKVLIDACNPFPERDGEIANTAREVGAGMESARLLPGARIVRAFNAIGAARMAQAYEQPQKIGMPIAGDDQKAIEIASRLIREIGYEPVLIGGLNMGKYLMPNTALAGEHSPEEIRSIAATLKP